MSIASFYNNPDLEDGFGATAGRTRPHRGLDFPKAAGTPIPSVKAGTVVVSEWSTQLGWVVEVLHGDGVFVGYCHMIRQGVKVGAQLAAGQTLGKVGNTGTESFGAHVHVTKSSVKRGVFGASMTPLSDPWPYIQAAINPTTQVRMIPMETLTFITVSAKTDPYYFLDPFTGRKRKISSAEWKALRAAETAGGAKLVLVEVPKADFNQIPG